MKKALPTGFTPFNIRETPTQFNGNPFKMGAPVGSYCGYFRRAGAPRALPRSSFRFVRVADDGHPGAGWSNRLGISRCSSS